MQLIALKLLHQIQPHYISYIHFGIFFKHFNFGFFLSEKGPMVDLELQERNNKYTIYNHVKKKMQEQNI